MHKGKLSLVPASPTTASDDKSLIRHGDKITVSFGQGDYILTVDDNQACANMCAQPLSDPSSVPPIRYLQKLFILALVG